jgi:hypothetical protein
MGGEAEVEDLHPPVRRDEQVLRLEVAVDDALVVRRRQAARHLGRVLDGLPLGQRPGREPSSQSLPFEELGDGERSAVLLAEVVDREDIRVREHSDGLRLALEAGEPARVPCEDLGQNLHGDGAIEAGVPGPVDLAHPARAERAENLVVAKALVNGQGHHRPPVDAS